MIIQHCRQQIIGGGDGVKIPCKMKVQIIHGNNLCIAAAGSSPLQAETGTKGWFPQGDHSLFSQFIHCLSKSHCRRRLPLSCRCGVDRSDKDQFPIRAVLYTLPQIVCEFCFISAIQIQFFFLDIQLRGYILNRLHLSSQCNFNI